MKNRDAISRLRKIEKNIHPVGEVLNELGKRLKILKQYDASIAALSKVINRRENAFYAKEYRTNTVLREAYRQRAQTYRFMNRHIQAIADFDKIFELGGATVNTRQWRAEQRAMAGDLKGALADYDVLLKVQTRSDDQASLYAGRGFAQKINNRPRDAIKSYTRAIELGFASGLTIVSQRVAYLHGRAQAYEQVKDRNAAIADYTRALKQHFYTYETLEKRSLKALERLDAVPISWIQEMKDSKAERSRIGTLRAECNSFYRPNEKNIKACDEVLKRGIKRTGQPLDAQDYGHIHFQRGKAFEMLKRLKQAVAAYRTAYRYELKREPPVEYSQKLVRKALAGVYRKLGQTRKAKKASRGIID